MFLSFLHLLPPPRRGMFVLRLLFVIGGTSSLIFLKARGREIPQLFFLVVSPLLPREVFPESEKLVVSLFVEEPTELSTALLPFVGMFSLIEKIFVKQIGE
jgi:hypothetical protein